MYFRSTSTSTLNPLELYTQVEVDENVFHIEENYFDSWNKVIKQEYNEFELFLVNFIMVYYLFLANYYYRYFITSFVQANIYFIKGNDADLLIDSGSLLLYCLVYS